MEYLDFLKSKMAISSQSGFDVSIDQLTPTLYPHVKDTVRWAIRGGVVRYSVASVCKRP